MSAFLLTATVVVGMLIVVGLHRVAVGPTVFDRLVAVALVAVNGVVLLLLISTLFGRLEVFIDLAIAYALLAFVLPLGLGKYFEREKVREREHEQERESS